MTKRMERYGISWNGISHRMIVSKKDKKDSKYRMSEMFNGKLQQGTNFTRRIGNKRSK